MGEMSDYEKNAWREIQDARDRWWRRASSNLSSKAAETAGKAGTKVGKFVDRHPRFRKTVNGAGELVKRGASAAGGAIPQGAKDWTSQAAGAAGRTVRNVSRAGLSPARVVAKHQKKGHPVEQLRDIRGLDLRLVDKVRGRNIALGMVYPVLAAGAGAGVALAITGGQLTLLPTAGASGAAGPVVVTGAIAADFTVVLAIISRSVGAIALSYGYDPKQPGEKLFVSAVINAGAASSAAAKAAAMKDLSRLAQGLVRNRVWTELNQSAISRVVTEFGKAMSVKFTKKSLGKVVPVVGIALGASLNADTINHTIETADMAYRRRFLMDKYPHLTASEEERTPQKYPVGPDNEEPVISILDLLAEKGGPDLGGGDVELGSGDEVDGEGETGDTADA